ncbi:hypothetical protein AAFF_G00415600 [Aldrovandia affinis]|uniref:Uncharacterized protein n=1 Tax=Aldrovandia affinis TaxID=143900 RepID=A0AAD7SAT5_9TELE|nr:hypothetical protein AAFF_G00415600 [Aldrovandia affinis]
MVEGDSSIRDCGMCVCSLPLVNCHYLLQGHKEETTAEGGERDQPGGVRHELPQQEDSGHQQRCGVGDAQTRTNHHDNHQSP